MFPLCFFTTIPFDIPKAGEIAVILITFNPPLVYVTILLLNSRPRSCNVFSMWTLQLV